MTDFPLLPRLCAKGPCPCPAVTTCKNRYDQPLTMSGLRQMVQHIGEQLNREDYIASGKEYLPLLLGCYDA
jgi:hypothetical protein